MPLQLLKISADETALIASLADRIWHAYYIDFISLAQIDYMLEKFYSNTSLLKQVEEGQEFYKIMDEEFLCGFIAISRKSATEYFIHKFYILPEQHGKSTGTKVMDLVTGMIFSREQQKLINIRLTVNRQNYKAINFYFKNEFIIEKVEDFDIGNGLFMTDFVMLRKLRIPHYYS